MANKGHKWTQEQKDRIKGRSHHNWKGNKVGYYGLHSWVRRRKIKPDYCEECEENEPQDLANISGEYQRDVNDFKWVCRKCHVNSDQRLTILKYHNKLRKKNAKQKVIKKECPTCGNKFNSISYKHRIYCSRLCYYQKKIARCKSVSENLNTRDTL